MFFLGQHFAFLHSSTQGILFELYCVSYLPKPRNWTRSSDNWRFVISTLFVTFVNCSITVCGVGPSPSHYNTDTSKQITLRRSLQEISWLLLELLHSNSSTPPPPTPLFPRHKPVNHTEWQAILLATGTAPQRRPSPH